MCGNAALCTTRLAARPGDGRSGAGSPSRPMPASTRPAASAQGHWPRSTFRTSQSRGRPTSPSEQGEESQSHSARSASRTWSPSWRTLAASRWMSRGRALRVHPGAGPAGANANFVSDCRPLSRQPTATRPTPPGRSGPMSEGWRGRRWPVAPGRSPRRCSIAAAGLDQLPLRFRSGERRVLSVAADIEGEKATNIWLCGEGRVVFRGVWEE